MKKRLVVYHASCVDGFTAAWVAWRKYGDSAEYVAAHYGDNIRDLPNPAGLDVLIVDFSYPREDLENLRKVARSVRVLDHHKTAEAALTGLDYCVFDMNRSGASLTEDELFPGCERSSLVAYVEDRDLWRWKLPDSREVSAWIASWKFEFPAWSMLAKDLDQNRKNIVAQGSAILRALDKHVEDQVKNASRIKLGGHVVPCINTTYAVSELVGKLAESAHFAVGWFQRQDGRFVYSLRSRGDFDVSEVAKGFGGGGHRNAAGFTVDSLFPLESGQS